MISKEQLAEIKARELIATEGPWEVEPDIRPDIFTVRTADKNGGYFGGGQLLRNVHNWISEQSGRVHVAEHAKYENSHSDAAFIAHARTDIPALITELERLQTELATLETKYREIANETGLVGVQGNIWRQTARTFADELAKVRGNDGTK